MRALVRAGADPDGANADGTTPLYAAAARGHVDVVRQLLAHGAGPGLREDDGEGCSPLEWAGNGHRTRTAEPSPRSGRTEPGRDGEGRHHPGRGG
ncbi:ankyrin repeat domain-containing protein, partial [Streptomyces hirsutus]|uniref:ankyrin repeat domain-containing protein n=1 Tax=Streptomyces hirsutus TaxID=35620 RepID=UPI0033D6CF9E